MDRLAHCNVTLEFNFVAINNQTMTVVVNSNEKQYTICPNTDTVILCNIEVELPTTITLSIIGKNMSTDTQLDDNHRIIKDKHVKLTDLRIDNISAPLAYLEKKIKFVFDEQMVFSNYFGFNGSATIDLDKSNAFTQQCHFNWSLTS